MVAAGPAVHYTLCSAQDTNGDTFMAVIDNGSHTRSHVSHLSYAGEGFTGPVSIIVIGQDNAEEHFASKTFQSGQQCIRVMGIQNFSLYVNACAAYFGFFCRPPTVGIMKNICCCGSGTHICSLLMVFLWV